MEEVWIVLIVFTNTLDRIDGLQPEISIQHIDDPEKKNTSVF